MDFIRPDLAGPRIAPFQAPQGDLAIIAAVNVIADLGSQLNGDSPSVFNS